MSDYSLCHFTHPIPRRAHTLSEFLGPQFKIFTAADGTPHSLATIHATENESKQVRVSVSVSFLGFRVCWCGRWI